jgi:transcriptional regulator with XRE-family HTH domain
MDADTFYTEFGRLLRKARRPRPSRDTKLTQADLAEAVGISRASIANIERGQQRVQLHLVVRLAEVLGLDIVELLPPMPSPSPDSDKITLALQGQGASAKDIQRALIHLPLEGR